MGGGKGGKPWEEEDGGRRENPWEEEREAMRGDGVVRGAVVRD